MDSMLQLGSAAAVSGGAVLEAASLISTFYQGGQSFLALSFSAPLALTLQGLSVHEYFWGFIFLFFFFITTPPFSDI